MSEGARERERQRAKKGSKEIERCGGREKGNEN